MRWALPILVLATVGCGPSSDHPILGAGPKAIEKFENATITVYRLDPKGSPRNVTPGTPGYLHGWKILEEKVVDGADVRRQILQAITSRANFGEDGAKCFDPGLGFRLVEGEIKSDFVICLDCYWVYCYLGPEEYLSSEGLTKAGRKELTDLYTSIFGAAPARIY